MISCYLLRGFLIATPLSVLFTLANDPGITVIRISWRIMFFKLDSEMLKENVKKKIFNRVLHFLSNLKLTEKKFVILPQLILHSKIPISLLPVTRSNTKVKLIKKQHPVHVIIYTLYLLLSRCINYTITKNIRYYDFMR